eukprot:CAMPEP_0206278848 /NCGR_PEP_ID=MMETSP0047_2-20121206/37648_1 /ASSEMBLY_ACC=CAM_ASM_000192 /TAXON_ID=195065 /ORGANISM="Chroomonas mesostigmatica_cf, Strain CCMP1168" /LENGTH=99 /DNA_ID=CAMNT_0053708639 /DNA_START=629 /DNA_END=928 /DNA_ORIENTATION=+
MSTPAFSSLARSSSCCRGYVPRSSCAANCAGLTKMLDTTTAHLLLQEVQMALVECSHRREEANKAVRLEALAPHAILLDRSRHLHPASSPGFSRLEGGV